MSKTESNSVYLKHSFSGARDADTRYEIDHDTRTITVRQETGKGMPFLSSTHMCALVFSLLPANHGIDAYNDDDVGSWTPKRCTWKVYVNVGDVCFRAVFWKHSKHSCAADQTMELYPIAPGESQA